MIADKSKILALLGNGTSPEVVATAVGVSPSYISQLLSQDEFASEVMRLRIQNLEAATSRDRNLDSLEDKLIDRLRDVMPYMTRPMEILKALQVVNAAKRRGVNSQESTVHHSTVVNLTLPVTIQTRFQTNSSNEVVEVEGRTLATIPSKSLLSQLTSQNKDTNNDNDLLLSQSLQEKVHAGHN